jgi:NAD(P)-dependent dehydrogenase (short-subunit alcohol dehydrogenase family)
MSWRMHDLGGKVAFVTGGASGIGLGIASAFLEAGMNVAIGDSSREHLDQAVACLRRAQCRVRPILVDVTDRKAMESAAAETAGVFGKVHVVVNNAGVQNPAPLSQTSYEDWDKIIAVNVSGVFNGIRAFLPHMRQHGEGGHLVTTASILGLFTAGANYGAYCASKFAAVAMMETLRAELAESNVGVSVLCPGQVRSNLEEFLKHSAVASDPIDIGRLVLRGVRNNDLYILTHPEFADFIQARSSAIMASMPADVCPSDERRALAQSALRTSIYLTERSGPDVR